MKALRTKEEIRIYLLLNNKDNIEEKLIADALQVEKKYEKELLEGKYEYGTYSDYYNNPFVLEDEDKVKELKLIEQIGGIVVYEPIFKTDIT